MELHKNTWLSIWRKQSIIIFPMWYCFTIQNIAHLKIPKCLPIAFWRHEAYRINTKNSYQEKLINNAKVHISQWHWQEMLHYIYLYHLIIIGLLHPIAQPDTIHYRCWRHWETDATDLSTHLGWELTMAGLPLVGARHRQCCHRWEVCPHSSQVFCQTF